jgi:hypothetical protein
MRTLNLNHFSPIISSGKYNEIKKPENIINKKLIKLFMKKYSKQDQKLMAIWAADCAERVLPFFENSYPQDYRPRKAIEVCRTWARTGVFKMADIRGASLDAHAAAREVKVNNVSCFAARAAGQAVATAHVSQHAFGAAYYALKAIAAANPNNDEEEISKELIWLSQNLPKNLRQQILNKIVIQKYNKKVLIKIKKDKDF